MSRAYGYTSYGGPETETWFDRPEPVPGPLDLVIKVKAVGVNPVDYKIRGGAMANPQAAPHFPLVLGVEAAGVVVAVGSDVEGFAEDDQVMGGPRRDRAATLSMQCCWLDRCAQAPSGQFRASRGVAGGWGDRLGRLEKLGVAEGETLLINGVGGGVGVWPRSWRATPARWSSGWAARPSGR